MPNKGIVIISDPIIPKAMTSHNLELTGYVFELARKLGFSVFMGRNVKSPTSDLRVIRRVSTIVRFLICCVTDLFPYRKNTFSILYINPNANPIWLIISYYLSKCLKIKITIHAHFIGTHDLAAFQNVAIVSLVKAITNSKTVILSAETDAYSRLLSGILGKECLYLPYPPIDQNEIRIDTSQAEATDTSRRLKLVFLGAPRDDKGITDLPMIIKSLRDSANLLEFRFQSGLPDTVTQHEGLKNVYLIQLPKFLTKTEFYSEIALSDIVLIPYTKKDFEIRGSSICQRAIYASSKILVRAGTSLVRELEISGYREDRIVANEFLLMSPPDQKIDWKYSEIVHRKWREAIL